MIKNKYICEPRPQQWICDSEIGYRNKPNYRHYAFGGIDGSTNSLGFRTKNNFQFNAQKGVTRIIGIGDSVMEGARVNAEDAFLGILERIAQKDGVLIETINAGVCGYSTYQERLFFERYVVVFHPDIVLVNFCPNDLLPTEDPFENVRTIYISYMEKLLRERRYQFSESEQFQIKNIKNVLQTSPRAWNTIKKINNDPVKMKVLERIFIEIPILEMKEIAEKNKIKFVYVFINQGNDQIKDFMRSADIDYVDCSKLLLEGSPRTNLSLRFDFLECPNFNPAYALKQISELNGFRYKRLHQLWIDGVGHPSYRGNVVIAQAIYGYLKQSGIL